MLFILKKDKMRSIILKNKAICMHYEDPLDNASKYFKRQLSRKAIVKDHITGRYTVVSALESIFMKMVEKAMLGDAQSQAMIAKMSINPESEVGKNMVAEDAPRIQNITMNILQQAGFGEPINFKVVEGKKVSKNWIDAL